MASHRQWTALLNGAQSQAARASLDEIAAALEGASIWNNPAPDPFPRMATLGEGAAGVAVFFAYMEMAGFCANARKLAYDHLNFAIRQLAERPLTPGLFSGFTGIAWAAQHITSLLGDAPEDFSEIDLAIENYVNRSPWTEDYDLIAGLVGLGVYCLERRESATASRNLETIIDRLQELAEPSEDGICWFTRPDQLPEHQRSACPEGYYNLGVAHGIPGVIALLARCYASGIAREKCASMLEGAVAWLLKHHLPETFKSSFSSFVVPGRKSEECRVAWCYGDAGLAAALLLAARCRSQEAWERSALEIARQAARRHPDTAGVVDVCICHGSAGLAHIFNRFYQARGDLSFAEASRYWHSRTLEFRKPGTGAAGYSVYTADTAGEKVFAPRLGIIEGIAGVGLTFLAGLTGVEPCWDRIFLMDIPLR